MREASSLLVAQDRESSEQRKEAVFLRERLAAVVREQDRLDRESTDAKNVITEDKRISSSSSKEVTRTNTKEVILTECLMQQEQQGDLVCREPVLTFLKEEVLPCERRLGDKEQELARLRQEVQESQRVKENSEVLIKQTMLEKNQLIEQITRVNLARDALEDEAGHLKEEVAKLRGQQEVAQLHVANITQGIDRLVSRLATREQEVADQRLRAESLEGEVERLKGVAEDWNSHSAEEGVTRRKGSLADTRIQELSLLTDKLRKELVVEKREAGERLGKEVATSSKLQAEVARLRKRLEEEVGAQMTAREAELELETPARSVSSGVMVEKGEEATVVIFKRDQPKVSPSTSASTTTVSQARAETPPSAFSNDSRQPSLKRPVDLEADSDYQKKACLNRIEGRYLQVSSYETGQDRGSPKMESIKSIEVTGGERGGEEEGGQERREVGSINHYSTDVEVEEGALGSEQENSSEAVATRTDECVEASSYSLQTLELVCDGCQSVFTRASSLRHHQAVAERCKRAKEPEPQEFACHRCSRQFTSKKTWNRHMSLVLNCVAKNKQREDQTVEVIL